MIEFSPCTLILVNTAACAILLMNALFLFALRGSRPVILIASVFLLSGFMPIVATLQHFQSEFYMRAIFNPAHVILVMVAFPVVYFYLFELMRPGYVRLKHWLAVGTPLAVYILVFALANMFRPLPAFYAYDQIAPYWDNPAMWVCLAGLAVCAVEQVELAIITMRMYKDYKHRMVDEFSTFEGYNLNWVRWIIVLMFVYGLLTLVGITTEGYTIKFIVAGLTAFVNTITTIFVILQKDIYARPEVENGNNADASCDAAQLETKREQLQQKLRYLLETDLIFKDPDLNADKVCRMLNTNRTYLWEVIAQDMDTNFYSLVNGYRLRNAESVLRDQTFRGMPLGDIATICGMRNLSTFSRLFRQEYGISPSEFRKSAPEI